MSIEAADDEEEIDHPGPVVIGEVLANRYQIESAIGEGAMGSVFKARHVKVGRPFAVKVLHKRLVEDRKVLQRFEREAELAGRLRHPNVIGVVDVGETNDGFRYMVMDFAEGHDLATVLNEAPMPAERIINLTRQMLEGLYHAHEQGLIHRDFKPENVIIERDDHGEEVPRIVDFGIAILREGGENSDGAGRLTTNGLVLGTPHYMAPEQAVADPIDHRIDLFALGIVVYEMLCGKLPFDGTGAEVARANLLLDPPLIAARVPYLEVDPLLEAFSRRLMSKKREMRPATAKAARELLDLITSDPAAAAAALGVPLGVASSRAPAVTSPLSPQRDAVHEDGELHPVESRTPIPPTPLLFGRAPTPHPFAGGEGQPAYLPGVTARPPTPHPINLDGSPSTAAESSAMRSPQQLRTDAAHPLDWEQRPAPSKRPLVFAIGGALVLAVIITIVATRGGSTTEPTAGSGERERVVVQATQPDPKPDIKPDVKPEAGSAAPVKVDDPIEIEPANPTKKPPQIKKQPDPKSVKPDVKPQVPELPDDLKMTKKPQKIVIDAAGLYALYGAVGRELATASKTHGDDAIAGPRSTFRMIQIQDAASTEQKREHASNALANIRNQLAAIAKKTP